ncbi:MAG TPA: twin-arginine translocase TatA/TatE family subunit [Armatimonadaceae bacterium]|jgi:sec-independent protein translocase protein TatA|nr:twin-arginine translocase TatA/TatE family subunit [Armatimonadaceae bacterium]
MYPTFAYGFGWQEILIIGAIVILLFGGTKLPQLAKGLGEGIREFKKSVTNEEPAARTDTDKKEEAKEAV